jgi:hypothetical protein
VNSIGLAEPTIQTASYGQESHIIVQIPTQDYGNISEEEKKKKSEEDITRAKETIGKVVKLEFREEKTDITEADKLERRAIAEKARAEIESGVPFETIGVKYRDQYEMVGYMPSQSGALPPEATFSGVQSITQFPYVSQVVETAFAPSIGVDGSGNTVTNSGARGYTIVKIESQNEVQVGSGTEKNYVYSFIFVSEQPSPWMPAKTAEGKILNDTYLNNASVSFSQAGAPEVQLNFNPE